MPEIRQDLLKDLKEKVSNCSELDDYDKCFLNTLIEKKEVEIGIFQMFPRERD